MHHLFPHMFTHPPVPSYNRPRARPLPRGVLLYPTPPAPVAPLPSREYHGPQKASNPPSQAQPYPSAQPHGQNASSAIASPGPPTPTSTSTPGLSTQKPGRGTKAKAKDSPSTSHEKENEPPAHEIECLTRCTLTIGPISYPGTELWVGRFVEPRATVPKPPKRAYNNGHNANANLDKRLGPGQGVFDPKRATGDNGPSPGWTPLFPGQRYRFPSSSLSSSSPSSGPSYRPQQAGPSKYAGQARPPYPTLPHQQQQQQHQGYTPRPQSSVPKTDIVSSFSPTS